MVHRAQCTEHKWPTAIRRRPTAPIGKRSILPLSIIESNLPPRILPSPSQIFHFSSKSR